MSVAAALGYRWDGKRSRLFFQTKADSYNEESLIAFLVIYVQDNEKMAAVSEEGGMGGGD